MITAAAATISTPRVLSPRPVAILNPANPSRNAEITAREKASEVSVSKFAIPFTNT